MLYQELVDYGLTHQEAQVYLALLELGQSLVQEIATKAGTSRTYTYEVLTTLLKMGLVSHCLKSGKKYFEPAEPERLLQVLKEKERKINSILPTLKEIHKTAVKKPTVEVYEGKEGIKTILEDILKTGKEVLVYGATRKQHEFLQAAFPNFIKQRIKKNIRTKVVTEDSQETRELQRRNSEELRHMRFLPKSTRIPTTTIMYGNNSAMLSFGKNAIGILIEDEAITKTQREIFHLLWKHAKCPKN